MKIAYDATTLHLTKGGTTVYLKNLLESLNTIPSNNEYIPFSEMNNYISILPKKITTVYRELIWRDHILPRGIKNKKIDLIHFPNHFSTIKPEIPNIITFHDIYILKNPTAFPKAHAMFSQYIIPKVIKSATQIIAVSNFTKNEILEHFDIKENKISVIHNGVSSIFHPEISSEKLHQTRLKYKLPPNYILYVGAIEPRKNVDKLIKAFDKVRQQLDIELVIVSFGGWKNKLTLDIIKKSSNQKYIHLLGYISDEDLPSIYNQANVFVYPSSYEGFGLPLLEAMSCGCPVIGNRDTVASEIIGDAGVLVDPNDLIAFTDSILSITEKNNSIKYKHLGIQKAKSYSWNKCANQTLRLYHEIANK